MLFSGYRIINSWHRCSTDFKTTMLSHAICFGLESGEINKFWHGINAKAGTVECFCQSDGNSAFAASQVKNLQVGMVMGMFFNKLENNFRRSADLPKVLEDIGKIGK